MKQITEMKANTVNPSKGQTTALWLSDLHLDRADAWRRDELLNRISQTESSCVVVTGDISSSHHLRGHLLQLASACAPRPLLFVLGNHDYHGSSIEEVDAEVAELCRTVKNLHHLNGQRIVPFGDNRCLIGHRGWPDARAGYGQRTVIDSPDRHAILDFQTLTCSQMLQRMSQLGRESAAVIRRTLPLALRRYEHVVILTHVPPFPVSVRYNNQSCEWTHLPHFVNQSAGLAIHGIAKAFPRCRITILAGHAHSSSVTQINRNICVRVAHARTGRPGPFEILRFSHT